MSERERGERHRLAFAASHLQWTSTLIPKRLKLADLPPPPQRGHQIVTNHLLRVRVRDRVSAPHMLQWCAAGQDGQRSTVLRV